MWLCSEESYYTPSSAMAEEAVPSPSPVPAALLEQDHAPVNPSPLNPAAPRQTSRTPAPSAAPVQREQREKKESLKKRESNAGSTASSLGKRKANSTHAYPSPQRFNVPPPKDVDYEPPKADVMAAHEPQPFFMPDGVRQLYRPIDLAENKRGYRYTRAIADPLFPHKQYYRSTSPPPHSARLSFEDADRWMHFSQNAVITTNEKGWRMVRSNVCAREGTLYYEIKIHRGVPQEGPDTATNLPQPHIRFGFARREAPLDAPVGFDGYSYGITDIRFETMHRSRPGKLYIPKKGKAKAIKTAAPATVTLPPEDQHVKEGDVIGIEIQLPALGLHQKVVSGVYNPAVDVGDGFDQPNSAVLEPGSDALDVIRDRIPVFYKGNSYFEVMDLVASRPMEVYADRATNLANLAINPLTAGVKDALKTAPGPNHEQAPLRTLPHSAMRVFKNGKLIGTAFENLLAFLPPASTQSKTMGTREGFDDGMLGYFPAVSCFWGGIAEVNFGDGPNGFWAPPTHIAVTQPISTMQASTAEGPDVQMTDAGVDASGEKKGWNPGRQCRPIGERYKEQVAEDILWDVIDEVDFFMQDGGPEGSVGSAGANSSVMGQAERLKQEELG